MISKKTKAVEAFKSGINCTHSILLTYSNELDFDKTLALQLSIGFAGGMGRMQKTCGAVTGVFMIMGIYNCKKYSDTNQQVKNNRIMIQEFDRRFSIKNGSTECRKLMNCDLNTKEGQEYAKTHNLHKNICEGFVADSIEILEDLINESTI